MMMKVSGVEVTTTVDVLQGVIVESFGQRYEVSYVEVKRATSPDGEGWEDEAVMAFAITKSGERSKAAPHVTRVYGTEADVVAAAAAKFVEGVK